MRLKNIIQDMIDRGDLIVDGLKTNNDNDTFRNPLSNYNKGGSSTSNDIKGAQINHLNNNTINHISIDDNQVNVIKIKDKYVLKGNTSASATNPKTQYNLVDQLWRTPT